MLSYVCLFAKPWAVAREAPLSVRLIHVDVMAEVTQYCQAIILQLKIKKGKKEHWSGLPFPSPGDLPYPGFEPGSPASPTLADGFFSAEPLGKPELM